MSISEHARANAPKPACSRDFPGGVTVVWLGSLRSADLSARLVEKSLLLKLGDSGGYQLLETIRQYSVEQLTAAGEIDAVRERHARFYRHAQPDHRRVAHRPAPEV